MSSRSWQARIKDILKAIQDIQKRTSGMTYETFIADEALVDSVLYKYVVIGEAVRHIPEDVQSLAPEIPWRLMNDMRNVVAHEYFQVEPRIIWAGIQGELPLLVEPLQKLLETV